MITFDYHDLDDLAAQFTRMGEISASGPKNRPASCRHYANGEANAYAKCAEIVRALAAPARPRAGIKVVTENGEAVG